jgi:hypothetical protein
MKRSRASRLWTAAVLAIMTLCLLTLVPAAGAAPRKLGAGTATFHLDPTGVVDFFGSRIAPYPVSPAKLSFGGFSVKFTMPVRGGTWDTKALRGAFLLGGGLTYVQGVPSHFQKLTLSGWRAGVNNSTGFSIVAAGGRSPTFFDQNLMGSIPSVVTIHGHKYAKVTNVLLFFNATSVGALTTAFTVGPSVGDPFGSVTLLARLK